MGLYDMPASLNYVLKVTRQKKLSFVGYSIGCTMFFVAMITHPELNERVDVMFAFAPTSTLADFRVTPVRTFLPLWNFLHVILNKKKFLMRNERQLNIINIIVLEIGEVNWNGYGQRFGKVAFGALFNSEHLLPELSRCCHLSRENSATSWT